MARLVKLDVKQKYFCKLIVALKDGTKIEHDMNKDTIVENLRYVTRKGDILKISGRISNFNFTMDGKQQTISEKDPKDTFNDDVRMLNFTIDNSEQYNSSIEIVSAKSIVEFEDEKDLDIAYVRPFIWMEIDMDMSYSNLITEHQELAIGDIFENMIIIDPRTPGKEITGTYILRTFMYNNRNNKPVVTGLVLENAENHKISKVGLNNIMSFHEIPQINVETTEELLEAFNTIEEGGIINMNDNIAITETIEIGSDKVFTLNMKDHSIIVPPPVNNRSLYAINCYGHMILEGGHIEARGIQAMAGGTIVIEGTEIVSRDTNGGAGVWVYEGGTLVVNDANFTTIYEGSTSDSSGPGCINNRGTCIINKGSFTSPNKRCYSVCSSGNISIPEGEDGEVAVIGVHGGIAIDGGTAEIHSGTYVSSEYYGLYVSNDALRAGVSVYGGVFGGPNFSVWVGSDIHDPVDSTVDIYGGTFNGPLKDQKNVAENAGIKVYGGRFSTKVEDEFLAEGCYCTDQPEEDGYYHVYTEIGNTVDTPANG